MNFSKIASAFIDKALTSVQKAGKIGKEYHIISDDGVIYFNKHHVFMCDERQIIMISDKYCYMHKHGAYSWESFEGDANLTDVLYRRLKNEL